MSIKLGFYSNFRTISGQEMWNLVILMHLQVLIHFYLRIYDICDAICGIYTQGRIAKYENKKNHQQQNKKMTNPNLSQCRFANWAIPVSQSALIKPLDCCAHSVAFQIFYTQFILLVASLWFNLLIADFFNLFSTGLFCCISWWYPCSKEGD